MAKAICYYRVSTDKQADTGNGLEAQQADCTAWALNAGLTVVEFKDAGISGGKEIIEDRPGLLAAISTATRGDSFVVKTRDRLARDFAVSGAVEYELRRRGAILVVVERADCADPVQAAIMRCIDDLFSVIERMRAKMRTTSGIKAKQARGEKWGYASPFGWMLGEDGVTLVRNPDQLPIVEEIKRQYFEGRSPETIATWLNDRGVKTPAADALDHPERHFRPEQKARYVPKANARNNAACRWHHTSVRNLLIAEGVKMRVGRPPKCEALRKKWVEANNLLNSIPNAV